MADQRTVLAAELFKRTLDCPGEQRSVFLKEACGEDLELRCEVEALLKFNDQGDEFLEQPAIEIGFKAFLHGALKPDQRIGTYRVVAQIGSGGMGEVYLGHDQKLNRQVAVKLVRFGIRGEETARHFRRQAQILASLNHLNIAQLYGAEITPDCFSFLIMEYVEGVRIDKYCDDNQLSVRDRLEMFRRVCGAVHYAHQRLIIHRDLKPANILITKEGQPNLLDFGIAKLLDPEASIAGEQTVTFAAAMTPEYARPEQVRGESMTTASDVYSLGVVLYELLTGQRPYRLTSRRPEELSRAITEQTPARPSSIVVTAPPPPEKPGPDRRRGRRRHELRGDLDNIVLMAMRKEPARRYESAAQFSADIQRHLEGLPVVARKDTFTYRASKFIRRHRVAVAAALLILLSLVGGIIATTWQAQAARHEKAKAEDVKNALVRMLNYSNPIVFSPQNNGQKTVKEILDETAKQLKNGEFSNQPEIKVELEQIIAECYFGEGNYALGGKHMEEYHDHHRKLYGEDDAKTLVASEKRAFMLFSEGKLTESEKHYRKTLPLMRNENG